MEKSVFVFGRGFLGDYVVQEFRKNGYAVYSSNLKNCSNEDFQIDIRKKNSIFDALEKTKPNLIINCAALTNLDFLEDNPEIGFEINAEGAKNIAIASTKFNAKLIHISTDGVFDGKKGMYVEEDLTNPINVYGKTKLLAENYVQQEAKNYLVLRTNFIGYDPQGGNLLNWIVKKLSHNEQLVGFTDVFFTPLEVSFLSNVILSLASIHQNLLLHLSSTQKISKYDFAIMVAETFDFDKNLIKKGISDNINFKASRPKDTSLSNVKAQKILNKKFPSIIDSLHNIKSIF